jgi:hypothetical protein
VRRHDDLASFVNFIIFNAKFGFSGMGRYTNGKGGCFFAWTSRVAQMFVVQLL